MTDLASAVAELKASIDSLRAELVRRDVYESDQRGIAARIDTVGKDVGDLEKRVEKNEDDRKADRRLLIAAFVAPLLLYVLNLYTASQGAA
ncbi:hypothetical protein [Aeromicrobium sp. Leaf291]|uniref:hypothetical protein n=1 Tax=Aeromicrobium sp. Leaf291 TaxID=1736325 RepID=UPI0006F91ADD|nr:hypothetical protein [Aeromicrobium sp. Leaf291]KQP83735.1 hypothetical protein ASF35_01790 [Aeromicrobium sp. Leaf291]